MYEQMHVSNKLRLHKGYHPRYTDINSPLDTINQYRIPFPQSNSYQRYLCRSSCIEYASRRCVLVAFRPPVCLCRCDECAESRIKSPILLFLANKTFWRTLPIIQDIHPCPSKTMVVILGTKKVQCQLRMANTCVRRHAARVDKDSSGPK